MSRREQHASLVSGASTERGWAPAFLLLALLWGASFMFIKVGLGALAPLQVALGRMVFGALFLLAVLVITKDRLPRGRAVWRHLFVAALLLNTIPFSLFALGETEVSSIVAGIWNATTPLLTVSVAMATLPEERLSTERAIGVSVGFAGVLVLLGPWHGLGGGALAGNLACLGAAVAYGFGFPYARKHLAGRPESVVSLSSAQLLLATFPLGVVLSVLALGALGTGLAYILNYHVIRAAGATVASSVTYVIPVFSTIFGVALLGETLTWNQPAGALVVIAGVAVSQGRLRSSRSSHLSRDRRASARGRP
jgi:drug/metabolite transporter (DMT)-like permease